MSTKMGSHISCINTRVYLITFCYLIHTIVTKLYNLILNNKLHYSFANTCKGIPHSHKIGRVEYPSRWNLCFCFTQWRMYRQTCMHKHMHTHTLDITDIWLLQQSLILILIQINRFCYWNLKFSSLDRDPMFRGRYTSKGVICIL